jgi:hypothetical protein
MSLENGYLKRYFKGIIAKKLSAVETTPRTSNQHEFNATVKMKEIFGLDDRKFKTDFLYIDDEQSFGASDFLTWYDARRNHPTRTEYRLYYPSTTVSDAAASGDSLFICVKQDDTILCIISSQNATITSQLYWLFDIESNDSGRFTQNAELQTDSGQLEFVARTILAQIGIEYVETDDQDLLSVLLERFGGAFPKTELFSSYARSLVLDVDPIGDPDRTLIKWFDMEEKLFFLLEQHTIRERLKIGFYNGDDVDVDGFVKFSLSVQNRRKSRAGLSLENHICALLDANGIAYSHTPVTENRSKPDFLFPDIKCYKDSTFPADNLLMLGAKSTCKDRWRQVLAEADRIKKKHLLTLEAAISTYQTEEMADKNLQLVIPLSIQKTYTEKQQAWLYSVADFLDEVRQKQRLTAYASLLKSNG